MLTSASGSLAWYGPVYQTAEMVTIAPSMFVKGIPKAGDDEVGLPTKLQATLDIIQFHLDKDRESEAGLDTRAKVAIHVNSREVIPMIVYVSQVQIASKTPAEVPRLLDCAICMHAYSMEHRPRLKGDSWRWKSTAMRTIRRLDLG